MKIKLVYTAALSLAVLLGSCSDKEKVNGPDTAGTKSIYLQINTDSDISSYADEPTAQGSKAQLLTAIIYFADGNGLVYNVQEVPSAVTLADLQAGYLFMDIPSSVSQVYVVGNYNSTDDGGAFANFPTTAGTNLSTIRDVEIQIEQVAYPNTDTGGAGAGLLTIMDGRATVMEYINSQSTPWRGDTGLNSGDLYADITLTPANSRLEIAQISYTGTLLQSFTLEAIYINYFYDTTTLGTVEPGLLDGYINNGSVVDNYDPTSNEFRYETFGTLWDELLLTGAGATSFTPVNGTWAYHVFGNSNPAPHIILKLTDVVSTTGVTEYWVTVKGYQAGSTNIATFERNRIYHITDLTFDDDDLDLLPETEDINIWVHVDVAEWNYTVVTPVI